MNMRTVILHAPLFSGAGYGHYARDVFKALLLNTPYKVCAVSYTHLTLPTTERV